MARIKTIHLFFIIAGLGIIVYANSLQNEFVWDDDYLILYNTSVQEPSLSSVGRIFTHSQEKYGREITNLYRPIQQLSYMLDFAIWGFEAVGFHLTNLLLHVGVSFLLFRMLDRLSGDQLASLLGTLIYMVHPLNTEAVSYISGRADPLAALFALLALHFYVAHRAAHTSGETVRRIALSSVCFALAVLSRESALVLPALLLLYESAFVGKEPWKTRVLRFAPHFSLAIAYGVLRLTVLRFEGTVAHVPEDVGLYERTLTFFRVFAGYLRLMFAPLDLHMERTMVYSRSLLEPRVLVSAAMLAVFVAATLLLRKRRKVLYFGLGWFLVALFPLSNVPFTLNAAMAEHWLYLPFMGIAAAAGALLVSAGRTLFRKPAARAALTLVLTGTMVLYFSILTAFQNRIWHDNEILFRHTLQYGETPYLRYNLANTHRETGRLFQAARDYKRVLEMDPSYYKAHFHLGLTYGGLGDMDRAIEEFQKTIELKPDYYKAHSIQGTAYMLKEMPEKAIECYEKALEINPECREACYSLGNAYRRLERYEDAERAYRRATVLDPKSSYAWNLLAECLVRQDRVQEAIGTWRRSLAIDPHQIMIRRLIQQHEKRLQVTDSPERE